MSQPPRLLDDPEASPLVHALLRAGADERPSNERRAALAAALAPAFSANGSAAALGAAAPWKAALAILFGAGIGALGVAEVASSGQPTRDARAEVLPTSTMSRRPAELPAPRGLAAAPAVAPARARAATSERASTATSRPAQRAAVPASGGTTRPGARTDPGLAPRAAVTPSPPPTAPTPARDRGDDQTAPAPPLRGEDQAHQLAAEVALLDRARGHLRAGALTAAADALAEHELAFPRAALPAEADVLRIDLLVRRGEVAAARALAAEFLQRHPASPLARRARELTSAPAPTPHPLEPP